MKQLLLLAGATMCCAASYAQQALQTGIEARTLLTSEAVPSTAKAAKNGDTLTQIHISGSDNLKIYYGETAQPLDSGLVAGTNAYGDKAFAERFDISGKDSSVLPLGVAIYFTGSAAPGTTKQITVAAWSQGPTTSVTGRPHLFFNGKPGTKLASATVSLSSLRKPNGDIDSFRLFKFSPVPTNYVADSFFVGFELPAYSWNSMGGDTIGVYTNENGQRHGAGYFVFGADTVVNTVNAYQDKNGTWYDNLNGGRFGIAFNYVMAAMFRVKTAVGVEGITRRDLTVFGTYPNPANNNATLRFSLKNATDVSVQIVDVQGRTVSTVPAQHLASGEHRLPLAISQLASGTYYCMIRTAEGDAMGIEMVVAK